MIKLKNFDLANKYFDFERKVESVDDGDDKINGWYKFINGKLVALFVLDHKLYYLYNSDKYLLTKSCKVVVEMNKSTNKGIFNIFDDQNKILSYSYDLPNDIIYPAPFDYIDYEEFKWEEFVEKIINNDDRRDNFITNLSDKNG